MTSTAERTYTRYPTSTTSASIGTQTTRYTIPKQAAVQTTDSEGAFAFEYLIRDMLNAGGRRKQNLATEIIDKLRSRRDVTNAVAWAAFRILKSRKPGRIDDCVGLLTQLGPDIVLNTIRDISLRLRPSLTGFEVWPDDFWYALVRSLGFIARQTKPEVVWPYIEHATRCPAAVVREASVLSLADIDTPDAIDCLSRLAKGDPAPEVRELAQEMLDDAEEATT